MNLLDELLDEIEAERQEQILQKHINFAHKQKWNFLRFKKLLRVNLNLEIMPDDKQFEEDEFVKEYHKFVEIMHLQKETFTIKNYLRDAYNVDPQNYTPVDYDAGNKY